MFCTSAKKAAAAAIKDDQSGDESDSSSGSSSDGDRKAKRKKGAANGRSASGNISVSNAGSDSDSLSRSRGTGSRAGDTSSSESESNSDEDDGDVPSSRQGSTRTPTSTSRNSKQPAVRKVVKKKPTHIHRSKSYVSDVEPEMRPRSAPSSYRYLLAQRSASSAMNPDSAIGVSPAVPASGSGGDALDIAAKEARASMTRHTSFSPIAHPRTVSALATEQVIGVHPVENSHDAVHGLPNGTTAGRPWVASGYTSDDAPHHPHHQHVHLSKSQTDAVDGPLYQHHHHPTGNQPAGQGALMGVRLT